ncbi:MAG: AAA family ATPase, partial [Bacteroidales bacterium]|nr:AAA family ATPase [Bacteroidales bacterium]
MKIIHTADFHIGSPRSPYKDGINLRAEDTKRCLDKLVETADAVRPDYTLISGDIFDVGKVWSDRCCSEIVTAYRYIHQLAMCSGQVVVLRGTPNHDGAGQIQVLEEMFEDVDNVTVVTEPTVLQFPDASIACLPGFDMGTFSAAHPDLSKEERNEAITAELTNIVLGMKLECETYKKSILMAHYTVPGANVESGQVSMLNQFEPVIPLEALQAADYDLVALGHIHRPQKLENLRNAFYSGSINTGNFNDEGQSRGFWIHTINGLFNSDFIETPYRGFKTIKLNNTDITDINTGNIKAVAMRNWIADDDHFNKIVRVHYSCTEDNNKALNRALLSKQLTDDGAFMVWEILPDKIDEFANRTELGDATDPEENLIQYLTEKEIEPERINDLVIKARPVIQQAQAYMTTAAYTGTFEPVEISVKNYRNYVDETFNFEDISFCTINGVNGSGKSSLFMDAIIDCLYEEPREGEKTGWIRNDEKARSASIMFTFRLGEHTFRVTRTRQRSGKGTLDISELVDGTWESRSCEKYNDTQKRILDIIGMDSMTFKSCALIMQDQYGIFLQAAPEDRVKVLGTLLGLDVYRYMERIVTDKGHQFGAQNRDLKNKIEIHQRTIDSLGEPEKELTDLEQCLTAQQAVVKEVKEQRDDKKLILTNMQEASERKKKHEEKLSALSLKIEQVNQVKATQCNIINTNSAILSGRPTVEMKLAEYSYLLERDKELAGESALYASKQTDLKKLNEQLEQEQMILDHEKIKLKVEQDKLDKLNQPVDEDQIKQNAADYEKYGKLLEEQNNLETLFLKARQEQSEIEAKMKNAQELGEIHLKTLEDRRADLERRAAMLADSGCMDIENAQCRFLADAKEAQSRISAVIAETAEYRAELTEQHDVLQKILDGADETIKRIGYDPDLQKEYQSRVSALSGATQRLFDLERRENQISVISASIEAMQSNIASHDKRLNTLISEVSEATQECETYRKAFEEHEAIQRSIQEYQVWVEKEKELPLAEERKATAEKRLVELEAEIEQIDVEIAETEQDICKEIHAIGNMEDAEREVVQLDIRLEELTKRVEEIQMKIGALRQKQEQITQIEAEISEIRKEQIKAARETADYDTLKMAFSSPGVPHQIIRSIVPALTSTANSILGQMTGGKMGVEFKLERMQKNGKEKTALDIY